MEVEFKLQKHFFRSKESLFAKFGELSASGFTYDSGVHGVRLKNSRGEIIVLPFVGQQIWRAAFDGKELTMKSMFDQPVTTDNFGESYGCFMLHCGMTAMGNPSAEDNHPQHGELPFMRYDTAYISFGKDEGRRYMEIGGETYYRRAFEVGYTANPKIRLYENETVFDIKMTITNRRKEPLSYAYLCHVNFHPVDGAKIEDTGNSVFVHKDIPETLPPEKAAKLKEYMERLEKTPSIMNLIDSKGQSYEPEIVFTIKYNADPQGWAHCMQALPEGGGHYVAFRPQDTPYGIRWISRTGSEDALGLALPATAEHKGLSYCKRHGQMKVLPPNESITFHVKAGYLDKKQTNIIRGKIK